MSAQSAIPRRTLHDELVALVRNMITEGELRPGSRIAETRLCTRFGVSRTPLREALKVLSVEGLVQLLPNKGATVVRVTHKQVEEILAILGALEALAGELACARIDEESIARIKSAHGQMVEHFCNGEKLSYYKLNCTIHEAILEAADNKMLGETHSMLQARLSTLLFVAPDSPPRWAEAVEDHEQMMAALEARDGAKFAQIARRHISHRAEMMQIALDTLEARSHDTTRHWAAQPIVNSRGLDHGKGDELKP
jgi:DNA-binding GntR family transcriptional regulator